MIPLRCTSTVRFLIAALVFAGLTVPASAAWAQLGAGIERFERTDWDEIPEKYRDWAEAEVGYLITEEEFEVFQRLDSEAKYERFMREFWTVRDPTPGTPANEYYDLHYERLDYANKFYGRSSPLPGWRTDRGRAYILLGEPRQISRVPADMILYPVETWFYSADPDLGLPPFFYLTFYQRYNTGDFRLYSPLSDGPEKLFNGAGIRAISDLQERTTTDPFSNGRPSAGYAPSGYGANADAMRQLLIEIDVDLANAAFSYYPSEAGFEFGITPLASELLIGAIENINEVIMPDATWAYNVLTGVTDSDVRFETLGVDALAVALLGVDGQPVIHFGSKAEGQELHVGEFEGDYYFTFKAIGSIVDSEARVLQNFESTMSGDLEPGQARNFTRNPFIYMDITPTLPGPQTFSLMLENSIAHSFGREEIELDVPTAHPPRLTIAGPVLALDAQSRSYDPFGQRFPFQYKALGMVPSIDGAFFVGQPLHAFEQVLLPATAAPAVVTLRIALVNSAGTAVREDSVQLMAGSADEHGVLPHLFTLDTADLEAGDYSLRVSVDENSAATREVSVRLSAVPEDPIRPFINAQPGPPAIDVTVALERAQQYRIAGDLDAAVQWLDYAQEREPEDPEILERYSMLLEETGRYERLIEVLLPASAENPRDHEMLIRLARTYALAAQHYDAIRFYERARMVMGEESTELLNELAASYQAESRPDRTRELLMLSLELDPEQAQARAMLDRLGNETTDSTVDSQ
ncbi:MAG: GWxTD domain-containing protein [Acidobacteria bacterium]|nr:GWxTD domain-containing protein [Acidobacteriota bacterium]